MSVSLVNEVNVYYTGSNYAAGNTAKVKSSITPFQKILKSEEEKRAETPVKAERQPWKVFFAVLLKNTIFLMTF